MNAVEIEDAISALAAEAFDVAAFPFAFLAAFGNKTTTIDRLRKGNTNRSDVSGGVLQRNNIHIAVCEPGAVGATLKALRESPETGKAKAKFILATDGETLEAEDLVGGETLASDYPDFANHFGFFLPLAGISTVREIKENPIDIKATGRLNKLYVELLKHNKDWAGADRRHDMNHFMARLIFCFFAEDTNIFNGAGMFIQTIDQMSARDGGNVHEVMSTIFHAMDVKLADRTMASGAFDRHPGIAQRYPGSSDFSSRQTTRKTLDSRLRGNDGEAGRADRAKAKLPAWAAQFPYVNGSLFSGSTDVPRFTRLARSYLIHAGELDWKTINPDIFGSMIQAVADDEERGALGMHYTSVPNILKVLNPLFLDDLNAQLEAAGDNKVKLLNLRKRMARIRVFDPACGSGNFLVIAYKRMRAIEAKINERRGEADRKSDIPLTNFRGIELRDFAAEIARLALIIAEFQCDVLYRGQQEALQDVLPLKRDNWITCGNALRLDWLAICPPTGTGVKVVGDDLFRTPLDQAEIDFENEGGETYICGNPPYLGSKWQSEAQKADLSAVFDGRVRGWKSLDYVAGWFLKAADYGAHTRTTTAFVATNSICQGSQVPILWPLIFRSGQQIAFAHTSFKWSNLASHNAGVTVVIVGISSEAGPVRRLFSVNNDAGGDGTELRETENINAYLVAAPNIEVHPQAKPADNKATMQFGNHPYYGGALIFTIDEARKMVRDAPGAARFIRPFYGSKEFIDGAPRACLWIADDEAEASMAISQIAARVKAVRKSRRAATRDASAQKLVATPWRFREQTTGNSHTFIVPRVSSENRPNLPVGLLEPHCVVQEKAFAMYDAPLWNLALIASRLHWVWIGTVCVRLEMRFSYSNTLGWNTFPVPTLTEQNKADLARCAEEILLAREHYFPATIADMYDPEHMDRDFPLVREAHERNDEVLERIYIGRRFKNDTERLEKLFDLYTKMTAAKLGNAKAARKRTRATLEIQP